MDEVVSLWLIKCTKDTTMSNWAWNYSNFSAQFLCSCYDATNERRTFCRFCSRCLFRWLHGVMWCWQPHSDIYVNSDCSWCSAIRCCYTCRLTCWWIFIIEVNLAWTVFWTPRLSVVFLTDDCDTEWAALQTCWLDTFGRQKVQKTATLVQSHVQLMHLGYKKLFLLHEASVASYHSFRRHVLALNELPRSEWWVSLLMTG